ncbi:MAG: MOSC domain-containing protein [Dokdonella sp.]
MTTDWTYIGTLIGIRRFAMKSAAGQELPSAKLGWHGLHGDRQFALHRTDDLSGLPWASARDFPQLLSWSAYLDESGQLVVEAHEERWEVDLRRPESRLAFNLWASDILGTPVTLMSLWAGTFDAMPLSIISTDSLSAFATQIGRSGLSAARFRANLTVDTQGRREWPERKWVGRELRIGEQVVVRLDRHTTRCEIINFDEHGMSDGDLFSGIRLANNNRAGVYATPVRVGVVHVGAMVYIR